MACWKAASKTTRKEIQYKNHYSIIPPLHDHKVLDSLCTCSCLDRDTCAWPAVSVRSFASLSARMRFSSYTRANKPSPVLRLGCKQPASSGVWQEKLWTKHSAWERLLFDTMRCGATEDVSPLKQTKPNQDPTIYNTHQHADPVLRPCICECSEV